MDLYRFLFDSSYFLDTVKKAVKNAAKKVDYNLYNENMVFGRPVSNPQNVVNLFTPHKSAPVKPVQAPVVVIDEEDPGELEDRLELIDSPITRGMPLQSSTPIEVIAPSAGDVKLVSIPKQGVKKVTYEGKTYEVPDSIASSLDAIDTSRGEGTLARRAKGVDSSGRKILIRRGNMGNGRFVVKDNEGSKYVTNDEGKFLQYYNSLKRGGNVKRYQEGGSEEAQNTDNQTPYLPAPYPINNKRQARQFTRANIKGAKAIQKKNDAEEAQLNKTMQYTYNPWSYKKNQKGQLAKGEKYENAASIRASEGQRKQDLENRAQNFSMYNRNPNQYLKQANDYYNTLNKEQQGKFRDSFGFMFDDAGNMKDKYDNELRQSIAKQQQSGNSMIDYNLYKQNLSNKEKPVSNSNNELGQMVEKIANKVDNGYRIKEGGYGVNTGAIKQSLLNQSTYLRYFPDYGFGNNTTGSVFQNFKLSK